MIYKDTTVKKIIDFEIMTRYVKSNQMEGTNICQGDRNEIFTQPIEYSTYLGI